MANLATHDQKSHTGNSSVEVQEPNTEDRAAAKLADFPDPDSHPGRDVVIFDGQCNFCIGQVSNLRRLDRLGRRLSFLSLHDPRVGERYPELTQDDLMRQMYVVDGRPEVDTPADAHGGGDAIRYLSRRLPLLWPVMPLLHLPGTAGLIRWAYKQVAKRRYQIAGKRSDGPVCDSDGCAIHFDQSPKK
ncbi:MAG: hypothetical protein CBB71_02075 [Rhodopirellula sp. TMED11]|nr:MAG: hypothetical protein CBB71_02075 [Rhodopirellula sp. TMED11]